ncbi:hypothetical protein CC86DRAFT_326462 [Ophiobolus disseminans]|uniref:Homeobox domain-containing protein n=1 Tax=Ophiobolus disseminans TaxID=1469910 RepID=A0A6A6ZX13_9PLEO|nr:hypothetical protein CC86DRAFT_326462 [Ophiobolus disseminans]
MLSSNDIAPKGRAASICSLDSGYGSNTLEEDDPSHLTSQSSSSTAHLTEHPAQTPIGLGISTFWDVHIENQLRLRKPDSLAVPVTTKLNVFTFKATSNDDQFRPAIEDNATCVACQLWDLTCPREGIRCDDCKIQDYIRPEVLHIFDTITKGKQAVSRLEIPQELLPKQGSKRNNHTRCSACELAHTIDPTSSTCPSCTPNLDVSSPHSPFPPSTVKRSCARRITKLPPRALQQLRAWLKENRDHPYPSADTKRVLAQDCGITEKQVTTWFTNTRARKLAHDRSHPSSDDEGAYESDYSSFANTPVYTTSPATGYDVASNNQFTPSASGFVSHEPSQLSLHTSRRGKKKDYRRVNTISPVEESPVPRTPATSSPNTDGHGQETWQCTFCYQQLVPKSWRRHEETQHRPKHQWTCLATGPRLTVSSRTGTTSFCAFCQLKNPSEDHFHRAHRISECMKKSEADRTFGRPDHLRQHIKNFHKTSLLDMVRDRWRRDGPGKNVNEGWTCGFCKADLKTWDIREMHIANHFKDGLTMATWREYSQPPPITMESTKRRQSTDAHTTLFSRLQRRLTNRPTSQPDYYTAPTPTFSNTFQPLPTSSGCPNITPASIAPQMPDLGLGVYMPNSYMPNFDFSAAPAVGNFGAMYPPNNSNNNAYGIFPGDEALHMDLDALANPELYVNFDAGFSGMWDQGRQ